METQIILLYAGRYEIVDERTGVVNRGVDTLNVVAALDDLCIDLGEDDEGLLVGADRVQHTDHRLRLESVGRDVVHNDHLAVCDLGGQCAEQCCSFGLLRNGDSVAAGLRAECYTAVRPLRRTRGTLACSAGALLLPGLLAAAADLGAGERGLPNRPHRARTNQAFPSGEGVNEVDG